MTASAVLWLRDRRELAVTDTVTKFLPDFRGGERGAVTIHHLLTHTSGLPDMLPENTELRRQHAPLSEFVARTCRTPLLFRPGEKVSYQSMGILLAAAIVEKVSGEPMPGFVARTMFNPLGMRQTSFGLGGRLVADTAQCQVPEAERSDWDWNSRYWRNLASPWGGAHATARDLGDVPGGLRSHGGPGVADDHSARDARDPDRHAAAKLRSGLAARARRLRPDLLSGDVRPLRFDRDADLARSGNGHDLRRAHDQTGHGLQGQPPAPRLGDRRTRERLAQAAAVGERSEHIDRQARSGAGVR